MNADHEENQITIGLPVYNGEKYLDATLESLISQAGQNCIVLISDNASTDGTSEILLHWQRRDSRIQVFRQESNIGAQRNFEWLVAQATTPWFMFAAHDDLWSLGYADALLEHALSVPGCELSLPGVIYLDEESGLSTQRQMDESIFLLAGGRRVRSLLKSATGTWIYGLHKTSSIKRSFKYMGNYSFTWGFDMLIVLSIILRTNVSGTNKAVFTHLETTISRDHYRPRSSQEQFALGDAFRKTSLCILAKEVSDPIERVKLFLPVLAYADRNGFKLRRAMKNWLKEVFIGSID
jgi:glycosyltransferase involved in cell wall biosynthesis